MKKAKILSLFILAIFSFDVNAQYHYRVEFVPSTSNLSSNRFYYGNLSPLRKEHFIKLPVNSYKPAGWIKKFLELQRDGLTGKLGEISIWLSKQNNAWLNKEGKGEHGWEELPYWLKGYGNIGYMLGDAAMISETKFWVNAVLSNQRANGDFGPNVTKGEGKRDLWTNMPMLWCLQSYYEYTEDPRVITFMSRYFKWQNTIPDDLFLEDYWENSRGGDNLYSIFWLYNITKESWLLDLAKKTDRNTANWRQSGMLPNWHNVNIAQGFREPAQYFMLSNDPKDLKATYNNFHFIRSLYGQVPGGMFGADENARKGYHDPRQATETCGFVEQMTSDQLLLRYTGDVLWAENCEDIAFNSFPAAFMPDYKSLRYLTAPNMVVSDSKNHHPGIDNSGPFLMMNPFSSRCCQHNHTAGWVYFAENSWMATPDNGLAAQFYTEGEVTAKVGNGKEVKIKSLTHYPFSDEISFIINSDDVVEFPLYLRIPSWCNKPQLRINGKQIKINSVKNNYMRISGSWKKGDKISLKLPMKLTLRKWERNKNSLSINYGPLTYSLKIDEQYISKNSKETAIGDSQWQKDADAGKWPSYEIHPATKWNYGIIADLKKPERSFKIVKRKWPLDNNPFTNESTPVLLLAKGKEIKSWKIDQYGLVHTLPGHGVTADKVKANLVLVPMGGARLRISAFPHLK